MRSALRLRPDGIIIYIERAATGRRVREVSRVMAREGDAYVLEACVEGQAVEAWLT